WPPGSGHPQVVDDLVRLFEKPPLAGSVLCIDAFPAGREVMGLFRGAKVNARVVLASITARDRATRAADGCHVPGAGVAGVLQVLLWEGRLKVEAELRERETLFHEMGAFTLKPDPKSGGGAWQQRDELVLAVGLAVWCGERRRPWASLGAFGLRRR